jgi:hypothetical protein
MGDRDNDLEALLADTARRAIRYRRHCGERHAAPSVDARKDITQLPETLAEHGTSAATVVALLDEVGSPATMAIVGSAGATRPFGKAEPR